MRTIAIVTVILLSAAFRHGGAENVDKTEHTEAVHYGRNITLGIFIVFDRQFALLHKKGNVNIPRNEYFNLILQMAEKTHFGNITCTNISLVLIGSKELNDSYNVENVTRHSNLDLETTLDNFKNYASMHSKEFGSPDVTVLLTGYYTKNNSEYCRNTSASLGPKADEDPRYRAYCREDAGGAYFKGICSNKSVVVAEDDGRNWHGVSSLSRQLATLLGVGSDILRNDSECYNKNKYFTSSGWFVSKKLERPGLSRCAVEELTAFIDSRSNYSNICWQDMPNATILEQNLTPEDLYDSVDTCSWHAARGTRCKNKEPSRDPRYVCSNDCCKTTGEPLYYPAYPPGKSCGNNGVCFNRQCFE